MKLNTGKPFVLPSQTNRTYMKIKIFLSIALVALTATSQAQSGGQLRAGINLANVSVNDNGRVDDANMLTSFQVGFIGDVSLGSKTVSLQPGLLFTGKGSKTESGSPAGGLHSKATTNPFYIELPLNIVFKAPMGNTSNFFIGAGPYLAIGIAGKTKINNTTSLIEQNYEKDIEFSNDDPATLDYEEGAGFGILKRFDYGLNGTAGIEGKSIVLGVNYGLGLAKLQSGSNNDADNNNKHRVLSFTVGFKL
jgi:hypothetical protein